MIMRLHIYIYIYTSSNVQPYILYIVAVFRPELLYVAVVVLCDINDLGGTNVNCSITY